MARKIKDWDKTQTWKPEAIHEPTDEDAVVEVIRRAADELRALYPKYDAFDALRRRCDPNGLFRNSFVDRVFGPSSES